METKPKTLFNKFNYFAVVIKRKKLLLGFIALVLITLTAYFVTSSRGKTSENYLTDTVKKSTVTSTISATGTIEPVSTVSLSFENSEVIKNIYVKVGDHVTTGQLLAEQATDNLEADVIQASASLKGASAKLKLQQNGSTQEDLEKAAADVQMNQGSYDLAKSTLARYQQLYQEGAISKADLDKYNSDLISAEGKLKQAEQSLKSLQAGNRAEDIEAAAADVESSNAKLKLAQNSLSGAKMYCSIDGIVSEVNGAVGQRASANNNSTSGGGFMTVISEALQLKSQVNEADIGKTVIGQKVEFTVNSYPNKTFTGKVSSIAPQATTVSNVQLYEVYVIPDENYKELKAGMPANVNIIVERHENTLTISKGAVTYAASYLSKTKQTNVSSSTGNKQVNSQSDINNTEDPSSTTSYQEQQTVVLVMNNSGGPAPKQVVLGLSDLKNYEVVRGLNEGETVVVGALNESTTTTTTNSNSKSNSNSMPMMGGPPPGR
ncbi:MAG: Macrolide export protein MacA [Pelotomaculum sp. PtaB.Bin013]|uniref:Efflux RND transporter periplasmic adaptor subunit n=1 Tax=Pelotomaculum isophthalicicum JI TaxID=947010 RepID=A0A9X4H4Q8_9FIRM|nr:efflux RND transporter periplasmic adaptor subunit [Pelotomaculum isophthalicicum]MDF9408928.1 efflux RND transporter periplasmic adaptor subunit [Pelotomaculum isophthalicicum JI]OPX89572.1 MAG: Macrolide export protein MacA [Pelotomaculum sp. PtaB.Bin013]